MSKFKEGDIIVRNTDKDEPYIYTNNSYKFVGRVTIVRKNPIDTQHNTRVITTESLDPDQIGRSFWVTDTDFKHKNDTIKLTEEKKEENKDLLKELTNE